MAQHVVLITSGQPSTNPRLVKEADALSEAGYHVTVIYQYWSEWATESDIDLLAKKKWSALRVGGSPQDRKIIYWLTRILQKTGNLLARKIGFSPTIAELAIGRCTYQLYREAIKHPADLYIAHNLAALPAAVQAAKKNKAKIGFDAEDFHRNETSDNPDDLDVRLKIYVENNYLPQTDYLTTASPLISEAYQKLYPALNPVTLLNVFFKKESPKPRIFDNQSPLKLFWFSQTIGLNRGIENVIAAMGRIEKHQPELHLLGSYDHHIQQHLHQFAKNRQVDPDHIKFHKPLMPADIFKFAAQFDVGLATETGKPYNRDICLTNKIFTYITSGLAVLVSDTSAQSDLISQYPLIGKIYQKNDVSSLSEAIEFYIQNIDQLSETKKTSYKLGQESLNWENESKKLINLIKKHVI